MTAEKACPFVLQNIAGRLSVLAFRHPLAGRQWVKGTINPDETPHQAARRELHEESGVIAPLRLLPIGRTKPALSDGVWHLFACRSDGLAPHWTWNVEDGGGLEFGFFWRSCSQPLDHTWHPMFHRPYHVLQKAVARGTWARLTSMPAARMGQDARTSGQFRSAAAIWPGISLSQRR